MPANERDNQILEKILKYCSEIESCMRTSVGALNGFATVLPIAMRLPCVCCRLES